MNILKVVLEIGAIALSVMLIILILLQVRGGSLGTLMGSETGGQGRTRRGLEKTLFQITIGISIAFLAISAFAVIVNTQG